MKDDFSKYANLWSIADHAITEETTDNQHKLDNIVNEIVNFENISSSNKLSVVKVSESDDSIPLGYTAQTQADIDGVQLSKYKSPKKRRTSHNLLVRRTLRNFNTRRRDTTRRSPKSSPTVRRKRYPSGDDTAIVLFGDFNISLPLNIKREISAKYGVTSDDVSSPQVRVALLTYKIDELSKRLQVNQGNENLRQELVHLVVFRRRHLAGIARRSPVLYRKLIIDLEIKQDLTSRQIINPKMKK